MKIIASVADAIQRLADHLCEPTQSCASAPGRGPLWEKDFEPRQGTDLSEPPPEFEFDWRVGG